MSDHAADHHGHDHGHEGHGHGHGPHHDTSFYFKTYLVLLVLFGISVAGPEVGEATGIQAITLITAFGIAVVKAGLVIRNFMHLTVEKSFVHYFLITSVAFMFLFFFAVAPDVMNHEGTRWENVAAKSWIAKKQAEQAAGGDHHGEGGHGEAGHGEAGHAEEAPKGEGDHH